MAGRGCYSSKPSNTPRKDLDRSKPFRHLALCDSIFLAYVGADVHLGARICAAAWGGQILVSPTTAAHVASALDDVTLRALGSQALKDIGEREEIYQVVTPGLQEQFPQLRTAGTHPTNLPPRTAPTRLESDVF